MDVSERVLKQLRWIKWLTALVALSLAATAGSLVWMAYDMSSTFEGFSETSDFADRAMHLLEQGKETQVLALAKEREVRFPKDPYVHWYRGKAYYQLAQYPEALEAIRRAQDLAPNWEAEYTGPVAKAIEAKLAARR